MAASFFLCPDISFYSSTVYFGIKGSELVLCRWFFQTWWPTFPSSFLPIPCYVCPLRLGWGKGFAGRRRVGGRETWKEYQICNELN